MPKKNVPSSEPVIIDVAAREAAAIGKAATTFEESEEITLLDPRLSAKRAEREEDKRLTEEQMRAQVDVLAERQSAPLTEVALEARDQLRVLFIVRDTSVLDTASPLRKKIFELERMFAEVHVLLVTFGKIAQKPESQAQRLGDTTWLYHAHSSWRWRLNNAVLQTAKAQLIFGDEFRTDFILANDPFESGHAGRILAEKYKRPLQVHVQEDFFESAFVRGDKNNQWRVHVAHKLLRSAPCVRTHSTYLEQRLLEEFKELRGKTGLLPVYYDITGWQNTRVLKDLRKEFPQFKFIIFHMVYEHEYEQSKAVLDGLFYLLRQYPTIGLVMCGSEPLLRRLREQIAAYHLERNVVCISDTLHVISYIKTANVVIHTSPEPVQNDAILMTAAAGVPLIAGSVGLASELFIDGESVLLCPIDAPPCFGEKVNQLLNDNPLRQKLALNAKEIVDKDIEQDYDAYLAAYKASIESCLLLDAAPTK